MLWEREQIIRNSETLEASVNLAALERYATKQTFEGLPNSWRRKARLEELHILGCPENPMGDGTFQCYADPQGKWMLLSNPPRDFSFSSFPFPLTKLRELDIRFSAVSELSLSGMPSLERLNLANNSDLRTVLDGDKAGKLTKLDLHKTQLGDWDGIGKLSQLQELDLSSAVLETLRFLTELRNLKRLLLTDSVINHFPSMESLESLEELYLNHAQLPPVIEGGFPAAVQHLSLAYSSVRWLPEKIGELQNLKCLDLSGLKLEDLPDWLPDLGLKFAHGVATGIVLNDTKFENVDMSIFDQPHEVILQWFRERREADRMVEMNEIKVVFLGDGGAGKGYMISRLLLDGTHPENYSGYATPGITITDKEYVIDGRKIQVHFWDFGGQEILHSMHRLFLTDRTMYVVVVNARDGTQNERAQYWLLNIRSFAGSAPVMLALNQLDHNPNASINEAELRRIAPGLTEIVKLSALSDSREVFNGVFTSAMLRQIGQMENLNYKFPISWFKVKQKLQNLDCNYIYRDRYIDICRQCGVEDSDTQKSLLNWFNDLGVSFHYGGSVRLEDYIILRPDWLTNAIYTILFNKLTGVRNGIVSLQSIYDILNPDPASRDSIRSVLPGVIYTTDEADYVMNVLRKFRLTYRVDEEKEFIPMLCDRITPAVAAEYEYDSTVLEFQMEYDYLPNNVLHRLMVELRGDLDTDNVWLTGARFVQNSAGLSAVVKCEGNTLKIYVRSTDTLHQANTYLNIIKDAVDQINADMGLARPVNVVVYKAYGNSERISYDYLIKSLEAGMTTYLSVTLRREIPISDILNQSVPVEEMTRDQLVKDIVTACRSMQSQKIFWNLPGDEKYASEDNRNTYIRDNLRNMGYVVLDQTLSGSSGFEPRSGALDLEIRRSPDSPWTVLEAANVSGTGSQDMERWDAHLDHLLNNFNPHGLSFLFLVSYLECGKEEFPGMAAAYEEHMRRYESRQGRWLISYFERLHIENMPFVRAAKCDYDCGSICTTVYHIMVQLGIDRSLEEKKAAMLRLPTNEYKVVFLGDGEAGKSLTVARLHDPDMNVREFNGEVTPGIDIKSRDYKIGDQMVRVNFWDFGGQEILHSMHRLFLSDRTLYVIVLNTRNDSQDERAAFWLRYVQTYAPDAPTILVLNKIDQNRYASINKTVLYKRYPNLKDVLRISAWKASKEEFKSSFIENLEKQIRAVPVQESAFLESGNRVREELQKMTKAKMTKNAFEKICKKHGVTDSAALLKQLERTGSCVCFRDSSYAARYMLLKPEWITNAIYIILFNLHSQAQNGIISHEAIYQLFDNKRKDIQRVRDTAYAKNDVKYILEVLRAYRLSFEIQEGEKEFLPMLCPRDEIPDVMDDFLKDSCLEFHMCFDYLPADVLYQLMVARRDEVNTEQPRIWLTGAVLNKSDGCSAAIIKEDNMLKFYVSQKKGILFARDYMSTLRHDVEQIVRKQKLRITENRMVYKFEGKEECFDYDRLLLSQKHGVLNIVSKSHERAISIQNILDQTFRSEDVLYEALLKSVMLACQIMQDNKDYWDKDEPTLNRHLRDLLRGMRYTVMDQPEKGASSTWKGSGRPDMVVLFPERNADVIIEVLKITGTKKADVTDWEKHLNKLTDNYNTAGHKMMILLSYLNCPQEKLNEVDQYYFDLMSRRGPAACGGSPEHCERLSWDDCPAFIRITRGEYYSKGYCPTVYHLLVYFPKDGIEKTGVS